MNATSPKSTNPPASTPPESTNPEKDATTTNPPKGETQVRPTVPPESSDPGPFKQLDLSHTGGKLHVNCVGLAWGTDLDLGNTAYAAAVTLAVRRVNDDFNSRRPKGE